MQFDRVDTVPTAEQTVSLRSQTAPVDLKINGPIGRRGVCRRRRRTGRRMMGRMEFNDGRF